jgi:restriction endonuclease S subunit
LKGLEISILTKSELEFDNKTKRIDSEYFQKFYLENIEDVKRNGFTKLKENIEYLSGGATPLGAEYEKEGIPFLRVQNIMQNYFNLNDVVYINKKQDEEIKRTRLKERDVLLTITGVSFGKSVVVPRELSNANINQHSVKITLDENLNPYFLSTFLNCKFGKLQSDKNVVGVTRPALDYEVIKNFNIPKIKLSFQNRIEKIINKSVETTRNSQFLYSQAESILLKEIGLEKEVTGLNPVKATNYNVKSFKDSFGITGRLDSEYYQKKYEDFEKLILENKNGYSFIKNEFEHITTNSRRDKLGYNYIEIGDVNVNDGFCKSNYVETEDLPANAKTLVEKGDLLISNVRPYRGAVTLIDFKEDNLIVSGAFTVLREKKTSVFMNEVLKVLLRTTVYKEWLLKFNVGTSYPVIKDSDVLKMPIPLISKEIQKLITEKIQESQLLKKQSEHLLELAKRAVEIAIEENEEVAIEFINKNK